MKHSKRKIRRGLKMDLFSNKQSCCKAILRLLLSHVGLFLIVCLYAVLGAYLFIYTEAQQQQLATLNKQGAYRVMNSSKKYIVLDMFYQSRQNLTADKFKQLAWNNIYNFHNYIVKAATELRYDGTNNPVNDWSFYNSLIFTITTMATIGYGYVYPKSFNGQVYCIIYACLGVPIMLVFLANIGDFLANAFRYVYSRGCCVVCRIIRKKSEVKKSGQKPKSVFKEVVGNEPYMPTQEVQVPITVNVCVLALYLAVGGVIFVLWEGWQFSEAIYFSFITLSTIGFGDYVPGVSADYASTSIVLTIFRLATTLIYIVVGMALLSMCINLIQEQIVAKFRWLAKEIGMKEETDEDIRIKHKYRKTLHEVVTTPAGKDGNECQLHNLEDSKPIKNIRKTNPKGSGGGLVFTDLTQ
ncbi:potassium channel subfamily K member 18 isoform X2 [Hyalella azteca]|uniref:Potassium channel subfamily K member 18 isoform X2 n=1 Tax=Hyalella azteca TaxID=294128 RepID=A0A8B7N0U2_HYAAZ|nr:potassium channel subfamily K member 18 isoform X2 [Hyalella azteca]XP_018007166.1 potassium channel subfamily K member 18 isoform X2 [Hyalella azteca]